MQFNLLSYNVSVVNLDKFISYYFHFCTKIFDVLFIYFFDNAISQFLIEIISNYSDPLVKAIYQMTVHDRLGGIPSNFLNFHINVCHGKFLFFFIKLTLHGFYKQHSLQYSQSFNRNLNFKLECYLPIAQILH